MIGTQQLLPKAFAMFIQVYYKLLKAKSIFLSLFWYSQLVFMKKTNNFRQRRDKDVGGGKSVSDNCGSDKHT